jgi:hypothetical protein
MLYDNFPEYEEEKDLTDEIRQQEIDDLFIASDKKAKVITEEVMRDFDQIIDWIRELK